MKKTLLILFAVLCAVMSWSQSVLDVTTIGGLSSDIYREQQPAGVPYVFVFKDLSDAVIATKNGGTADWYEGHTLIASGYTQLSEVQDGATYRVVQGALCDTFVVFNYQAHRLSDATLSAVATCEGVSLTASGVEPMAYRDLSGSSYSVIRSFGLEYSNLVPDSSASGWAPVTLSDTFRIADIRHIDLPTKLFAKTSFTLCDDLSDYFYGTPSCLVADSCRPVAVAHKALMTTALRGDTRENEIDRVVEASGANPLRGSAPLNVLFESNVTPTVEYFRWDIKKGTETLSTRTESGTRYVFEEPGAYTVSFHGTNSDSCSCDTLFTIEPTVSLLEVPNVFTPNGDGVNDEFRVAYRSLASFHAWIFNRWGHQIYSWSDPAKGWNGQVNGRSVPEGAYYYVIEAKGTDDVRYKRSGAINLLRGGK